MTQMKFDDDNIEQIGDDDFIVVNYDNDTTYLSAHCDTTINGKHTIIDTIYKTDTLIIEKTTFDKEIQIIEKLMEKPDFGKSIVSVLILVFVAYSVVKKWNCKKEK